MRQTDQVTAINGIGEKTSALYNKLNIFTVHDLLNHYPRDYEEWKDRYCVYDNECYQSITITKEEFEEFRDYINQIKSSGKTLLTIINDILDFSKIESGKMEIIPVQYEMSSLINDLYNMINIKAREKIISDFYYEWYKNIYS